MLCYFKLSTSVSGANVAKWRVKSHTYLATPGTTPTIIEVNSQPCEHSSHGDGQSATFFSVITVKKPPLFFGYSLVIEVCHLVNQ